MATLEEFARRRKMMQEQMAKALSQSSTIAPGEPPAKAWQPLIGMLGGMIQDKRLASQEKEARANYQKTLADALAPGKDITTSTNELMQNPDTTDIGLKLRLGQLKIGSQVPSNVQEWNYYNQLPPAQQEQYLRMKRADKFLDVGSGFVSPSQTDPTKTKPVAPRELKPTEQLDYKSAQAEASALGKLSAEKQDELSEMEANLPRLETVVAQLSELGKKATYTKAGQAYDIARREIGLTPREESVARKEYISKVDNEVLPLLRATFGAQFTQKEGESLKQTLGDPNASTEEKEAVLRSFIDSKRAQIETQRRKLGKSSGSTPKSTGVPEQGGLTPEEQAELEALRKQLGR